MKCQTVEANTVDELDQKTNDLLTEGWQLNGTPFQKVEVLPAIAKSTVHRICLGIAKRLGFNPVEIKVGYAQQVKIESLHTLLSEPVPSRVPRIKMRPTSRMRLWQETLRR
jgi:hypothetical protein